MTIKVKDLADEDGNSLPALDVNTDVGQLAWLLEFCRIRGFRIGPMVQVGNVSAQIRDMRLRENQPDEEHETDIWEAAGHVQK